MDPRQGAKLAKGMGTMRENKMGKVVVDAAVQVHREL